jgi:hypothetical protein
MNIFITGFLQVFFVAINTYFLSKEYFAGAFVVSFLISFTWSYNVKKVAFGKKSHRIIYSLGASFGCITGLFISRFFI